MTVSVSAQEWARAKQILAEKMEAAKISGDVLPDIKIRRKDDPEGVLQHSFHYICKVGKMFAADYVPDQTVYYYLGTGATAKGKNAVDENGKEYILTVKADPDLIEIANIARVMQKRRAMGQLSGVYYSYTRALTQYQAHFKRALNRYTRERYTDIKQTTIFAKTGDSDLQKFLVKNHLTFNQRRILAIQMALELYDFHTKLGEVHRDFKTENIVIDTSLFNTNRFDFHLTIIDAESCEQLRFGAPLLFSDDFYGTPEYMSPESLVRVACQSADVYAYGVVLLRILFPKNISKGEISPLTLDLMTKMNASDPTLRPPLPDVIHALWDELPPRIKNDESNPAINIMRDRIGKLPPPLTAQEIIDRRVIDDSQTLAAVLWSALWDNRSPNKRKEISENHSKIPEIATDRDGILDLLDMLKSANEKTHDKIIERCSEKLIRFLNGTPSHEDTVVTDISTKLEKMLVWLVKKIPDKKQAHPAIHKTVAEVNELGKNTRLYSVEPNSLAEKINTLFSSLPESYKTDPAIVMRMEAIARIWSALPEGDQNNSDMDLPFAVLSTIWGNVDSSVNFNPNEVESVNVFKVATLLNSMLVTMHQMLQNDLLDPKDPFTQKINTLFEFSSDVRKRQSRRLSADELIKSFVDIFTDSRLYEPTLSEGLRKFTNELTMDDPQTSTEVRNILNRLMESLAEFNTRGMAFYNTQSAPTVNI